ncbi:MAG TPA: LuxR C-terminal-related transcriptional regulator [Iamia sp.]
MGEVELMGRADELALVGEVLDDGRPGVVLAGPGGVGKTRLAVEGLRRAERAGWQTRRLTATRSAAGVPLAVFAPLLDGADSNGQPLGRVREAVRGDGSRRGVLLVDDAHLVDPASAGLLLQLAADGGTALLVTIRTGEPTPDGVTALWKDGHATRLEVGPLGEDDLGALASGFAGGELEPATCRYLLRLANGNALALRELVMGATAAGRLQERSGQLRLRGPVPITDRLTELVATRLRDLGDDERRTLELIALGEPIPVDDLVASSGVEVVERLERERLVEVRAEDGRPVVWMSHPLHGEILREELQPLRRSLLTGQLCDLLEAKTGRTTTEDIQLARWWIEAGRAGDPVVLRGAALTCLARGDALSCVDIAAVAWDRQPEAEVGHLLGRAQMELGRYAAAADVLAEAQPLAADEWLRVRIVAERSNALRRLGEIEAARTVLEAEVPQAGRTAASPRDLIAMRASLLNSTARFTEALALVTPLLDDEDDSTAGAAAAASLTYLARPEEALRIARRARALAVRRWEESAQIFDLATYDLSITLAHYDRGELATGTELAQGLYDGLAGQATGPATGGIGTLLAHGWLEQGQVRTALACSQRAMADYKALDVSMWWRLGLTRLVAIGCHAGALDVAAAAAAELPAERSPNNELFAGDEHVALAWLAWLQGDPPAATAHLDTALAWAWEHSAWRIAIEAVHAAHRLGVRTSEPLGPRASELAGRVEGALHLAKLAQVVAGAAHDGAGLEDAAARFEAMGALLYAAEAFADASRARRRADEARAAMAAARRSAELAERCEGARTPALRLQGDVVPLSPREREVALMASTGLTTPEIAERLYLSNRTVQNHLNRAYEKLGVSSRKQLADVL